MNKDKAYISQFPFMGMYFDHKDKEYKPINPKRGTESLTTTTLEDYLKYTITLDPNKPKHHDGGIFGYKSKVCGMYDPGDKNGVICECNKDMTSNVVYIDVDGLSRKTADRIFNGFELLHKSFPALVACQKSSGYYVDGDASHGAGLHFFVRCPETRTLDMYDNIRNNTGAVVTMIKRLLNIDIYRNIDKTVLTDPHKRFFTHYGEYKYIEGYPVIIKQTDIDKMKELYPDIFKLSGIEKIRISRLSDNSNQVNINIDSFNHDLKNAICINKRVYSNSERWVWIQTLKAINPDIKWVYAASLVFMIPKHSTKDDMFTVDGWKREVWDKYNSKRTPEKEVITARLKTLEKYGIVKIKEETNKPMRWGDMLESLTIDTIEL